MVDSIFLPILHRQLTYWKSIKQQGLHNPPLTLCKRGISTMKPPKTAAEDEENHRGCLFFASGSFRKPPLDISLFSHGRTENTHFGSTEKAETKENTENRVVSRRTYAFPNIRTVRPPKAAEERQRMYTHGNKRREMGQKGGGHLLALLHEAQPLTFRWHKPMQDTCTLLTFAFSHG